MLRPAIILSLAFLGTAAAADIELPTPRTEGGKPLLQALKERHTARVFSPDELSLQTLSNLLWAAWGVNRPDGRRTAPSASNRQEIDVYAALASGLYLYDAREHRLRQVLAADLRAATGTQPFVAQAPLNLVYVADMTRANRPKPEDAWFYAAINTGFISQNVYLFCASEGLATVVRGLVNREELAKAMKLRPDQRVVVAQTVGYPPKR